MGSIHEKNQRSTISCYCTSKANLTCLRQLMKNYTNLPDFTTSRWNFEATTISLKNIGSC
jgi:hypothetical protein